MRRIILTILFIILLINSAYALDYDSMIEGQRQTMIDAKFSFDSELKLPTEGENVNITFMMTPYLENIETNESFDTLYFLDSPDGKSYSYGVGFFPSGPYEYGKNYYSHIHHSFDTPGIWTLNYFVINYNTTRNNSLQEVRDFAPFRTKKIHVLSYYEANSMTLSNNSYKISILGVIGTFFAFLMGTFLNYLIDHRKFSPKIKVNCSHGFVTGEPPVRTFSIEAINYGRTIVTLSSVGLNFNNKFYLFNFIPLRIYNAYKNALEKISFSKSPEELKLLILNSEIVPLELPKELLPGKAYSVIKDYDLLIKNLEGKVPKRAYFTDQTGKIYYSTNIKKMFRLK